MNTGMSSMRDLDVQIGAAIREARLSAGHTQSELAAPLGVTHATIARYESGARSVPVVVLVHIAQLLHVPFTQLIPGTASTTIIGSHQDTSTTGDAQAMTSVVSILEEHPQLVPIVL